ncbi:MAG: tRNA (adenosine(37)-N6)-dimethylallyltransferase MiaA [Woeseia sp.]
MPLRSKHTALCLMGPTASGKTGIAVELAAEFPLDIISVDSALVYRGMDIGTAKPDAATLRRVPHRLLDIKEPEEPYSAGDFVRDAWEQIRLIRAAGRIPLLVGGTMMYFRALTRGLAELPQADEEVRAALDAEAAATGWPEMHRKLAGVDPAAAVRISANDRQRIQRALEVYRLTGRPLTEWHTSGGAEQSSSGSFLKLGLYPEPRAELHRRIEQRFQDMLDRGFVDEVRRLRRRPGMTGRSPAMRAVGYRQLWSYLEGDCGLEEAIEKAVAATRQLAKRQLTWLRREDDLVAVNPLEPEVFATIKGIVAQETGQ